MRFYELKVGQRFRIEIGGAKVIAEKTSLTQMTVKKINSDGYVVFDIKPDLNQDDVFPVKCD